MTIDRFQIANYLDGQFSSLAVAIGQSSYPEVGYQHDIDNALRKLGTAESDLPTDTVEDSQREAVFALAAFYALDRFWNQFSDRANFSLGDSSYNFSNQLSNLEKKVAKAEERCARFGYSVSGGGWSLGNLNLDWLEPEVTG